MSKRVVIIGAVALGPKVACRLRRLDPAAEITLLDRDSIISYGGCGIPYYIGGDVSDIDELCKTSSHTLRDAEFFRLCKRVRVMTRVEAVAIERSAKRVKICHLEGGREEYLPYDKLVLATGATAARPPIPGVDHPRVLTVSDLHDAEKIKKLMVSGKIDKAVVIGAGPIGLEIAEALADLWGANTLLVEMEDQVLPTLLGRCIGRIAETELRRHGVDMLLDTRVLNITESATGDRLLVTTSRKEVEVDLVVLATGVRPNTHLALQAGLAIGVSGGISVDRRMRTSDPDIYAGGDCVELRNVLSGENTVMALGSLANRQGRIIAQNIAGGQSQYPGTVGTFCLKLFDLGISKAGLTYRQAKETGYDPVYGVVSQVDHAHFYPKSEMLYLALIADRKSRKILGIEAAGKNGEAVKSRVDAIAVLLAHGLDVDEVCSLEVGYAPPFASAMDIVNNAGNVLDNILAGENDPVDAAEFLHQFRYHRPLVVDIRGDKAARPMHDKYGDRWLNIPQNRLVEQWETIPRDESLFLLCDTGLRSYEAQVFLRSKGYAHTRNIQGGYAMIKATEPDFG